MSILFLLKLLFIRGTFNCNDIMRANISATSCYLKVVVFFFFFAASPLFLKSPLPVSSRSFLFLHFTAGSHPSFGDLHLYLIGHPDGITYYPVMIIYVLIFL